MTELVRRLANAYVGHFNPKHQRVGALFEGTYKAALVERNEYYLYLTRYIHLNPRELLARSGYSRLDQYPYSSYPEYLGKRDTPWVHHADITSQFEPGDSHVLSYRGYAEGDDPNASMVPTQHLLDHAVRV
jgi:putative transposase